MMKYNPFKWHVCAVDDRDGNSFYVVRRWRLFYWSYADKDDFHTWECLRYSYPKHYSLEQAIRTYDRFKKPKFKFKKVHP